MVDILDRDGLFCIVLVDSDVVPWVTVAFLGVTLPAQSASLSPLGALRAAAPTHARHSPSDSTGHPCPDPWMTPPQNSQMRCVATAS